MCHCVSVYISLGNRGKERERSHGSRRRRRRRESSHSPRGSSPSTRKRNRSRLGSERISHAHAASRETEPLCCCRRYYRVFSLSLCFARLSRARTAIETESEREIEVCLVPSESSYTARASRGGEEEEQEEQGTTAPRVSGSPSLGSLSAKRAYATRRVNIFARPR